PATTTTFREQMSDDSPEGIVDSFEWCLQEVDEALQQLDSPLQRVATFVDFVVTDSEEDGDYEIRRWNVQPEGGIELSEVLGRASREELESGAWRDRLEDPTDT